MAYNFLQGDRDQLFLMPPDPAEWLDADHLVWFVLEVVGRMDLAAFFAAYRRDGRGGAAFDPAMMVALLLYSYAVGERSTRKIEERCQVDVAYRVVSGHMRPDHSTISRFRKQHVERLEGLFVESVRLCAEAGLARVATVAIDGRRVAANASVGRSLTRERIERDVKRWFEEADEIDAAEDAEFGEANRGDEVPQELRTREGRRRALDRAQAALDAQDARHRAEQDERTKQRSEYTERTGKRPPGREPKARAVPPSEKVNLTDPDSRILKGNGRWLQGYNTQAVVTEDQIVIGSAVVRDGNDQAQLTPMLTQAYGTLDAAGVEREIKQVVADAGYGTEEELGAAEQVPESPELFIATGHRRKRDGSVDPDTARGRMHEKLETSDGHAIYRKRRHIVEPVFGQHHVVQRFDRFSLRGLAAVNGEYKLVNAAHNILKLWRHATRTRALHPA